MYDSNEIIHLQKFMESLWWFEVI